MEQIVDGADSSEGRSTLARGLMLAVIAVLANTGAARAADVGQSGTLDEVTVTGSKLILNGNDAPTPLTVLTLDALAATTPGPVYQQLSEMPAFVPTMGGQVPSGYNANANTGVSALNLRGIGAQRALILFDGHRLPPSTPDGFVNINLMPQLLMDRVEVVTGGASAVYGSDAVSGVVNFVLDHKFNGVKVELQDSISGQHDDKSYQVGIAAGTDLFGNRGHIEASFQRMNSDGLPWTQQSRPNIYNWSVQGSGTQADPFHLAQGARAPWFSYGGLVTGADTGIYANGGYSFNQNGVLSPFNLATDGGQNPSVWLTAASKIDQGFVRFDYDLTDTVHAYANVALARDVEYGGFSPGVDGNFQFGSCNAFLSAAQQAAFGCTNQNDPNQPIFHLNKVPDPLTNLLKTTQSRSTMQNFNVMAGLEGQLPGGFRWDSAITLSQTSQTVVAEGVDHDPPLYAAMDAVKDPATGQIVCNVTLTNPGLYPGCVPINFFGPTSESAAALAYTFGNISREAVNKTMGWEGTVRGNLFNVPAGPVGVALSADFRRQELEVTSTSLPDNPTQSCLGLRFGNCDPVNTHSWGNFVVPLPPAHQNVYESSVEVNVPLLKDLPLIKALSTNDAFRFTRYANTGAGLDVNGNTVDVATNFTAKNWKLGLVWDLNDQWTVRVARSRDMRAPNLWDLYNPPNRQPNSFGTNDFLCDPQVPCPTGIPVNGGSGAPSQSGGNPNLKPEVGNTLTVGLIYRPTPNFSMSADYYDIKVTDAITVVNGSTQAIQQACYSSGGTSPYCALQVRANGNLTYSPTNTVLLWYIEGVNLDHLHTKGVDVEMNYRGRFADRSFTLRGLATYTPTMDLAGVDYSGTDGLIGNGVGPSPKWRANLQASINLMPGLDLNASERWRSSMRLQTDPTAIEVGDVASVAYTNLNLTYALPMLPKSSVFLNIQNLFDRAPPHAGSVNPGIPGGSGDGWSIGDDVIGRYFTVGFRGRF
jgi:outer membrane receptor protein involved in Fe transport